MTILFVCTGNTCRSPLALAWWRALQSRGEVPGEWSAFSAGLALGAGDEAARHAIDIARGWGVDLSGHRARPVDAGALRHVDVVVALASSHARAVGRFDDPTSTWRVLCLSDFLPRLAADDAVARLLDELDLDGLGGAGEEIADPFGGSREAYEACAAKIQIAVAGLAQHLKSEIDVRQDARD